MAWKPVLVAALAFGADALRTSFAVSELRDSAAKGALLEEKYLRVASNKYSAAVDYDPSLLYPAYNLSVPIDHFHNDSLYEPHVSCSKRTALLEIWLNHSAVDKRYIQPEVLVRCTAL